MRALHAAAAVCACVCGNVVVWLSGVVVVGHADGGIAELSAACIVALVKQYSAAASALAQPDAISALSQALVRTIVYYLIPINPPIIQCIQAIADDTHGEPTLTRACVCVCVLCVSSPMQGGAEEPTQSFVLDLGLRVVRLGGGAAPVDTAEMRDLIGVALRLSDPMRGGGGGDPTVTKLAQQLLAEAGAA